jgi:hypothetical protein
VDHPPHVGLVDPHAEGVRRHDDPDPAIQKALLNTRPFPCPESRVVGFRTDASGRQGMAQRLDAAARRRID